VDPVAVVDPAPAVPLISVEDSLPGRDGTDVLDGVEWLIFKDRYVKVSVVDGAVVVLDTILLTPPVADPAPAAPVSAPSASPSASASAPVGVASPDLDPAADVLAPVASEPVDSSAVDALISPPLVKLSRGRSVQRCTDGMDRFVYTKQSLDRKPDRISGFNTTQDKIILEGLKWAKKLGVSLVNVASKRELKMAQYSTAAFVYHEGNGNLYCNANGDKKSWGGQGGKFARLDAGLDVNPANFSIL
jgi:Ca2+-binding RTX toxin-like protein